MSRLPRVIAFAFALAIIAVALPADAAIHVFKLHDHPDGSANPPSYGLRLDDLVGDGEFTFSFDYMDGGGIASVFLTYDDVTGSFTIVGRAYGGKDNGGAWDGTLQGWVDISFSYVDNVVEQDDCAGSPGNDIYVTAETVNNAGTVTLDGWGGDAVFAYTGKANGTGCAFIFDNDTDSKGNSTIADDPSKYSGSGWLAPPTTGSRDWLFVGEMMTVPVEETTWGGVKALFSE